MLTHEDRMRLDELAGDVYNHVFSLLDGEPDMDGDVAGHVATSVEALFRHKMTQLWEVEEALPVACE